MARRSRRADEVTPKLHYRPGVDDPDLEATIVGFYGTRQEVPVPCTAPLQPIDNTGVNCIEPRDTVAADSSATVSVGTQDTISISTTDTVVHESQDMVSDSPEDTVAFELVCSPDSVTAGDRPQERGRRTYERTANKCPTDTVAVELRDTIAISSLDTVAVVTSDTMASDISDTVAADISGTVAADRPAGPTKGFWYTEGKEGIFPVSRVRRIVLAQDALTHSEESVYDVLWGPKNQNRDDHRLTSIGYDGIAKAARVTKMNAKWIVERLVHKGFVKVETLPDPLRRIPTSYRVFGYRAALEDMRRRNRFYIVRTGNGVLFAHPYNPADTASP